MRSGSPKICKNAEERKFNGIETGRQLTKRFSTAAKLKEIGMTPKRAEEIALMALGWIASDNEMTAALLGQSGASVDDLKTGAQNPDFLGFVMDSLLTDDRATEAFITAHSLDPTEPLMARQLLPGGDLPNWT